MCDEAHKIDRTKPRNSKKIEEEVARNIKLIHCTPHTSLILTTTIFTRKLLLENIYIKPAKHDHDTLSLNSRNHENTVKKEQREFAKFRLMLPNYADHADVLPIIGSPLRLDDLECDHSKQQSFKE